MIQESLPSVENTLTNNYVNQPVSPVRKEPTVNWHPYILRTGVILLIALLAGGGIYVASNLRSSPTPVPQQSTSLSTVVSTEIPTSVPTIPSGSSPTIAGADLFADPSALIYEPGKGFTPDARRIIDITTLQTGLEKYRVAKGKYPASLQNILPDFAPMYGGKPLAAIPVDPETDASYEYKVSADGISYQLSATLSSRKQYTVVEPKTP